VHFEADGVVQKSLGGYATDTVWAMSYSFDTSAIDGNLTDTSRGEYDGLTGQFSIGSDIYSAGQFGLNSVLLIDNTSSRDVLQLTLRATGAGEGPTSNGSDSFIRYISLTLRSDSSGALFNSDAANEVIGTALSDFDQNYLQSRFNMQFENSGGGYLGEVNGPVSAYSASVVPVPATAWLFGSALGLLVQMRRKLQPAVEWR